jgi:hypothetical protein
VIAQRERMSSGFSPMVPLGGEAAEMATRRRSIEAIGGAPIRRCSSREEERLKPGWVRWIMGVLSSRLL